MSKTQLIQQTALQTRFNTRYNPPQIAGEFSVDPSMTQQNFKDECDINLIIQRAMRCGDTTVFNNTQREQFYDNTTIGDYQNAMDVLSAARDDFLSLPSNIRANFNNDLETYVSVFSDPSNHQYLVDLGLLDGGKATAQLAAQGVSATPPVGDLAPKVTTTE